ncbi:MAG: esterase-like activity of phytase family protein, partial [Verrucomicrobia bacterium]|nr:esterase-like activity of phytase family protein [Verrucomicrobiota bacterium]
FGSGTAYDPNSKTLYLTTDRGPGDGNIDFSPRFYSIPLQPDEKNIASAIQSHLSAHLYKDSDGKPFTGLIPDSSDPEPRMKDGRRCLDPEGLALMEDGNLLLCEEYMPSILQFKPDGTFMARLIPPENYFPRNPTTSEIDFREATDRTEGREDNRGFEGIALSPDGKTLYTILQSALTQDGGKDAGATRLLVFDAFSGTPKSEYAVRFTDPASLPEGGKKLKTKNLVFSDLLCLPDGRLLALERDNRGQDGSTKPKVAIFKSVCVLDLTSATDLLSLPDKPYSLRKTDPKFKPLNATQPIEYVKKNLLFDFRDLGLPSQGLAWDQIPEKWEGLALLNNNRLLVMSDNDFLNPELNLSGKKVPFPKCQNPIPTWLFTIQLP